MNLYFGLTYDTGIFTGKQSNIEGNLYAGPRKLLDYLEQTLGLYGHPDNIEHLRIEQYRQKAAMLISSSPHGLFYAHSFEADQLATAVKLLQMRDELLEGGWDFNEKTIMPERLRIFALLEQLNKDDNNRIAGLADRRIAIVQGIENAESIVFEKIILNEPLDLLAPFYQRLFLKMKQNGSQILQLGLAAKSNKNDLAQLQNQLTQQQQEKKTFQNDGSVMIFKSRRETDAAVFLAKLLKLNPNSQPVLLIPEKNQTLDNAIIQEGLPSLGVLSASLARPSLQILKLITAFVWQPVDPYKLLEFVSLAVKPLADDLSHIIAGVIAQVPGINSERWNIAIAQYFDDLEERSKSNESIDIQSIRKQYEFWFRRRRYDIKGTVPKIEIIEIFDYLSKWSYETYSGNTIKYKSLLVLSEQAKRVKELLEAIPDSESQLTNLNLERIIRTIYEPSPVLFRERELHSYQYVYHSASFLQHCRELVWWNFTNNDMDIPFSNWYENERAWLFNEHCELRNTQCENKLLIWQRLPAIMATDERLILVVPNSQDGTETLAHPLMETIIAKFNNVENIVYDIDNQYDINRLEFFFKVPAFIELEPITLGKPKAFLTINHQKIAEDRAYETLTSLESLFYFPYQWVFKYKAKLSKSSILSIVQDKTLLGNLAHRFIEELMKEDFQQWSKQETYQWIDDKSRQLLVREGAVLLMYGREPERASFINRLKYAAWTLINLIRNNQWQVIGTELDLEGNFCDIPVRGKADLALKRDNEIAVLDLKWGSASWRNKSIKNQEDLQLVMYAKLISKADSDWAHTGYFMLNESKLIARNNLAFKEIQGVSEDDDYKIINADIWQKMENTFNWRKKQLQTGSVEVRSKKTILQINEKYENEDLLAILEMRDSDAAFDDYRTLINLID